MKENAQRYGSKIEMLERDQVLMTGGETKLADLVDSPLMFAKVMHPNRTFYNQKDLFQKYSIQFIMSIEF
jgi:hypothetical protein